MALLRRLPCIDVLPVEAKMHKATFAWVVLVFAMTGIPSGHADEVPTLNIQQTCQGIASHANGPAERGDPGLSVDQCIKGELQVRSRLVERWNSFSAQEKSLCTAETHVLGSPSYTDVLTCLEMAQSARKAGFPPPPSIER
jgi:hypothetical protein